MTLYGVRIYRADGTWHWFKVPTSAYRRRQPGEVVRQSVRLTQPGTYATQEMAAQVAAKITAKTGQVCDVAPFEAGEDD